MVTCHLMFHGIILKDKVRPPICFKSFHYNLLLRLCFLSQLSIVLRSMQITSFNKTSLVYRFVGVFVNFFDSTHFFTFYSFFIFNIYIHSCLCLQFLRTQTFKTQECDKYMISGYIQNNDGAWVYIKTFIISVCCGIQRLPSFHS